MRSLPMILLMGVLLACSKGADERDTLAASVPEADSGGLEVVETGAPPRQPLYIGFTPEDLTSSVRDSELLLRVGTNRVHATEEILAEMVQRVSLQAEVSGEAVPVKAEVVPAEDYDSDNQFRVIRIVPDADLGSEWHTLRVDLRELESSSVEIEPAPRMADVGGGFFAARIHPDSAPVIQMARVCLDPEVAGRAEAEVKLSEQVDFVPKPSTLTSSPITAVVGGAECKIYPNVEDDAADEYARTFIFICNEVSEPYDFELAFLRPLNSESGVSLTAYRTEEPLAGWELYQEDSLSLGDECLLWNIP